MSILNIAIPLFGLFVGSFLNSCIDRLPHHKSTNPFDSLCPFCEKPMTLYEGIPLLGYMLSKGRCTQCHAHISLRYPAVEVMAALICLLFFRRWGLSLEFFAQTFFVFLLIIASFIDFRRGRIPNILTTVGLAVGIVLAFLRKPFFAYQDAFYGIVACGGILFAIAFCCEKFLEKEIMGFGDIMLLCVIGAFCGLKGAVFSLLAGSLLGTLIGIPIMLLKGKDAEYAIPFGAALSLGALFYMSFGDRFVYGFLRFVSGSVT